MENNNSRIVGRIRKMLALANDAGATEAERETAMRMAHATLAKHNIEMREVEASGKQKEEDRVIIKREFYGRPWARMCSNAIADMCFCLYLVTPGRTPKQCVNWFLGKESNATTAADLAEYVCNSIWKEGSRNARNAGAGNEYIRNFATAAGYEIAKRCREIKEAALKPAAAQPGTSLVLANIYQVEALANRAMMDGMKTRTIQSRAKATHNYEAQQKGAAFGKTVSLNRQVNGTTQRKLT